MGFSVVSQLFFPFGPSLPAQPLANGFAEANSLQWAGLNTLQYLSAKLSLISLSRDVKTRRAIEMDIRTNSFCASGMHLPNGSFVTFGGNSAVTTNGDQGSQTYPDGQGAWDSIYQDFDGRRSIRIVNPCRISDSLTSPNCRWFDEPEQLSMKRRRWYSSAEPTAEGQIVIIGGFVNGGYINRFVPNVDPAYEGGSAEPTYEYFPPKDGDPEVLDFVVRTSGLNSYPHTFLMPSGRMLLQANISTSKSPFPLFVWPFIFNQS